MAILVGMDDILIDEKKYVSSKQAAKITGYAKDYIGQLCREGRVPARLVGRSWYVLETAIQDHRFGDGAHRAEEKEVLKAAPKTLPWTQQAPRYEAAPIEVLPTAERPAESVIQEEVAQQAPESIQNSWKAWFDRVGQTFQQEAPEAPTDERPGQHLEAKNEPETSVEEQQEEVAFEQEYEDTEVNVPIHTVYKAPPRELLPRYTEETVSEAEEVVEGERTERTHVRTGGYGLMKLVTFMVMLVVAALAALGSGYVDKLIISVNQVHYISGLEVYNK